MNYKCYIILYTTVLCCCSIIIVSYLKRGEVRLCAELTGSFFALARRFPFLYGFLFLYEPYERRDSPFGGSAVLSSFSCRILCALWALDLIFRFSLFRQVIFLSYAVKEISTSSCSSCSSSFLACFFLSFSFTGGNFFLSTSSSITTTTMMLLIRKSYRP